MSRIIALGWAAALTVQLIAADLPAQEPRPDGAIDFEGVIAERRPGGATRTARASSATSTRSPGVPRRSTACSRSTRRATTSTPKSGPISSTRRCSCRSRSRADSPQAGIPVGDDETVLIFRRVGRSHPARPAQYPLQGAGGSPLDKSVKQNYTDSVLMALPIIAMNPMKGERP